MRPSSILLLVLVLVFTLSCSKDEIRSTKILPSPGQPTQNNSSINLVAENWIVTTNGTYINGFPNFIKNMNPSGKTISVYVNLQQGNQKMLISNTPFPFYGGKLWSETTPQDLNIFFQSDNDTGLPFYRLEIVVIIQ